VNNEEAQKVTYICDYYE